MLVNTYIQTYKSCHFLVSELTHTYMKAYMCVYMYVYMLQGYVNASFNCYYIYTNL